MGNNNNLFFKPLIFWSIFIFILLLTIYNSVGYYHTDEHFQILEFANWKLDNTSSDSLPWEFKQKIRPALQPVIALSIYHFLELWGDVNPFQFTLLLRSISALLLLLVIYRLTHSSFLNRQIAPYYHYYRYGVAFLWFIPFVFVRFSSESWATSTFLLAIISAWEEKNERVTSIFQKFIKPFFIGIGLGFSFEFRFQMGIMIFAFFLWQLIFERHHTGFYRRFFSMALGLSLLIIFGVIIDSWFYQEWVLTSFNYFTVNLIEEKASSFGVAPFWYYGGQFLLYFIPPFSLLFLFCIFSYFFFFPKSLITWITGSFILIHTLIPHKEIRFLIPIALFTPFMIITAKKKWISIFPHKKIKPQIKKIILIILAILNTSLLLIMALRPADDLTLMNQKITTLVEEGEKKILFTKTDDNPFYRIGLKLQLYLPPNLVIHDLKKESSEHETIEHIYQVIKLQRKTTKKEQRVLWITDHPIDSEWYSAEKKLSDLPIIIELVYQLPHPLLKKINYFNWIEKSKLKTRYLYQIDFN